MDNTNNITQKQCTMDAEGKKTRTRIKEIKEWIASIQEYEYISDIIEEKQTLLNQDIRINDEAFNFQFRYDEDKAKVIDGLLYKNEHGYIYFDSDGKVKDYKIHADEEKDVLAFLLDFKKNFITYMKFFILTVAFKKQNL